jgi:hypothetical protein
MSYIMGGENMWCVLIIAWGGWGHGEARFIPITLWVNDMCFVCGPIVSPPPSPPPPSSRGYFEREREENLE